MKITRQLLLTGSMLLLFQWAFSQAICGFDIVHNKKMKEDPGYRKNVLANEASIRSYLLQHPHLGETPGTISISQHKTPGVTAGSPGAGTPVTLGAPTTLGAPYTIPVVVHIMNTGGAIGTVYNPTDAQILGAISYLNQVYNGTWPTLSGGAGDLQIQFAMAQRDPNCNPTNGIDRVDASSLAAYASGGVQAQQTAVGVVDTVLKNLSRWDPTQYYNVWVVNKIDGVDGNTFGSFIAGFAYLPGASQHEDGIIMLATQMIAGQKTLPHEIGHAFYLYHPFQNPADINSLICPANSNCSLDGDQVCDTDPITIPVNFVCRTGQTDSCTGAPYAINTENNYMNYTTCYTLFTAGQKARMLAAAAIAPRLSLTTSQGGTAPSAGSSPCSLPKIDFELSGDQQTETTATSSGCRSYKDYVYNMIIGFAPSAAATATLSKTSGTAVQGIDYDLTTNGNFVTPSSILNFPAASAASQPFTLRVYDDAIVNGTRSLTLGYTVNNGGGNATLGDGRPNFKLIINDNDAAPTGPVTSPKTVGADWGAIQSPFVGASPQSKAQFLYYASELKAAGIGAGNITGLSLDIDKASAAGFTYQGMTIKLGQTNHNSVYTSGSVNPLPEASLTAVYNSNYVTSNGWNNFTFATPFAWDGTSNLVVEICYDNGALTSATDNCEGYQDGSGQTNFIFATVNCGTAIGGFGGYTGGTKPLIQFTYANPGASVESVNNSSISQYLGPNTDVYFYDQANGQLMARIQNLSAFDYGCTQVVVDRAGTGSSQFWNSNTANYLMNKTFHVVPTTNNASGSYNISLYYTQGEVNGWQTATGQTLGNIKLVKTSGQISSVTPANPAGAGTLVTVTPSIGSLGTNTSLTYNFTNGFSGFGAGVPGIATLPITLLDFEGRPDNGNADLDWTTSLEENNKGFSVERSPDGNDFKDIGYVASGGNSSTPKRYSFTDLSMLPDNNFYRLKQTDLDGIFTYSKTILIRNANTSSRSFTILSNPFTDNLDLLFSHPPAGKIQIRLLDMTGKELYRQSAGSAVSSGFGASTGSPGSPNSFGSSGNLLHIHLSGRSISAGVYILEVRTATDTWAEKILKK